MDVERVVAGGVGLGRDADGKVVLAEGALPGERVTVELTEQRRTMARGEVRDVLSAADGRVRPPCPQLERGCGGCDLMHAAPELQRELKTSIVVDALARIGKVRDAAVSPGEVLATEAFRTVLRCTVTDEGRVGLRRRRSHEPIGIDTCRVAHPRLEAVLAAARFPGADEVVVRVGARTGETLVVVSPDDAVGDAEVPPELSATGVVVTCRDGHALHEIVGRRRFRVSAGSFFQCRPDGAEALVRAVRRALGTFDPNRDRLVDLYGGVGLFTAGLHARRSILVERSSAATGDAIVNLAELGAQIVQSTVDEWSPVPAEAVVADPPRAGLGPAGVAAVTGTGARYLALVSCDPASMARDVKDLRAAGYELSGVELVDMFPHTHHIETVAALVRAAS